MKRLSIAAIALFFTGCLNIDFDPPNVVTGPRILAITAEPPEVAFGQDVVFEALVVDENANDLSLDPNVELRFMVCVSLAAIVSASGLASGQSLEDNCSEGGDDLVHLVTGEGDLPPNSARLPGTAVLSLVEELMMGGTPMPEPDGGTIDPRVLQTLAIVIAEVGVPLRVRLEVWRDGEQIMTGFKRFAITQRESPTTNPPPPRFSVNGVWLNARSGDPHACIPEDGALPEVEAESEVTFAPDENEEAWMEQYPVVALTGELQINDESAYYSWFSTGGLFASDITQRPERNVVWTAPVEPGDYPIWLVVRDGHLGSSYCRADVRVIPAPPSD